MCKFVQICANFEQNLRKFRKKTAKISAIFNENFEIFIQHSGNRHFKRSQTNENQTHSTPDLLGIFILYSRARFFLEAPFAEVLSGLLWTAYWPLVFVFSPFFGVVLARSFFPHFSTMDSKTVQRSALCRSRRELSNAYLFAKFGFDTAEEEP